METIIKEVEKIVEKVVYQDRIVEVERQIEVPMINDRIVEIEKIVEKPVEVIKIEQVIQEVEKIVYEKVFVPAAGKGGAGKGDGASEVDTDCDCLTGARFLDIWNKMFNIKGMASTECLTEEQFVTMISKGIRQNVTGLMEAIENDAEIKAK